jgi:glycosyltransferase involved in cell wall biosynthesis
MRICMVAYAFYENDTRIMRYAEALAERGDQVDVIALRREHQSASGNLGGVNVFRIQPRSPNSAGKLSYLFEILLFLFRAMFLLTRRHVTRPYDVIHVHSVPDFLVFTGWLPKLTGSKIILDIHDLLPEFYASKYGAAHDSLLFKWLILTELTSCRFSDHVIAANDLWQERLISRSVRKDRCSSMVNVPDQSIFSPQGRTRNDGKFIILYPGTLNRHQGVDLAIRAFALIMHEAPEAEFHIYGEGSDRNSLAELIQRLGLQSRVKLNGFISTRGVARLIENADLGVVPKRKDGFGDEAFSTKIMEFMAMRVPVIVPDTRIDRYYFNDSSVRFFKGGDEQDLAQAMLSLIRHPEQRRTLVRNAFRFVEHNNWDLMKIEYLALIDSLGGVKNSTRGLHKIFTDQVSGQVEP